MAEAGFPVHTWTSGVWKEEEKRMCGGKFNGEELMMDDGHAPGDGEVFVNKGVGWTLRQIAEKVGLKG